MEETKRKNIFNSIMSVIMAIFSYAFLGIKVCTIIPIKKIFHLNKKSSYRYSPKKLLKLEREAEELLNDLSKEGATRSKKVNTYYYKVRLKDGKIKKGKMNGSSKLDINSFLVNEGYTVYSIKTSPLINILNKDIGGTKLKTKELVFFLTELSTFLESGLPLNESIKIISRQMKNATSRRAFQTIFFELSLGSSFSQALEKVDNIFPPLLINMVKASEASGNLVETLKDLANYYSEVESVKRETVSALMYPLIVSIFAILVIIFILTFIIPEFVKTYNESNMELNAFTKFIINLSNFFSQNILNILLIFIIVVGLFIILYKYSKDFRKIVQTILMHLPIVKDVIMYNELAIITKTFASLLKNNVFITDSVDILAKITNNEIYKDILNKTINNIVRGEKISLAFKDHWAIPDTAYFMLSTGEETGRLAEMMDKVSRYYQDLHRSIVNNLKTLIEPILIAVLAIVVGGILIAVVVPMFQMYGEMME